MDFCLVDTCCVFNSSKSREAVDGCKMTSISLSTLGVIRNVGKARVVFCDSA